MPSDSLKTWSTSRQTALDELESAHSSIGGSQRGRRYATLQINHAYAVLLSSQFQGFCRDLHSEAANHLVQRVTPSSLHLSFQKALVQNRRLDSGNPNPGNIGSDFGRFGLVFWDAVRRLAPIRNKRRQDLLEELNIWRNAIAHQDFTKLSTGAILHLQKVQAWRSSCEQLAIAFDKIIGRHIHSLTGINPW